MSRTVKTTVWLDRRPSERVETLARALEELLRRYENRRMLERLNAVCAEPEDDAERRTREGMGCLQQDVVKGEW